MKTLLTGLICFAASSKVLASDSYSEAANTAVVAAYKQFGLEAKVNDYIENNIVPKKYKEEIKYITTVVDIAVRQRVDLEWKF